MADGLRQLLSPDDSVIRTGPAQAGVRAARATRALPGRKRDVAVFHAVARPDGEVRQARSREPVGVLRSACDGLAGTVPAPAVVGHGDDRVIGRACGNGDHDAAARLPPAEAARGSWLEM